MISIIIDIFDVFSFYEFHAITNKKTWAAGVNHAITIPER